MYEYLSEYTSASAYEIYIECTYGQSNARTHARTSHTYTTSTRKIRRDSNCVRNPPGIASMFQCELYPRASIDTSH